jgi:hypothetical protein
MNAHRIRSSVGTTNNFQGRDDNAVRLEESLKEDVNLLGEYLTRRLESKFSVGAVAWEFIASCLEQMRAQYPI